MRDMRLRAFHAVAIHKSFTKGALHLHLSQQAVSLHIRRLEEEFGARLFVRGQKQADLTEEGRSLFGYAQKITALYSDAEEALFDLTGKGGALRVAITNGLTIRGFPVMVDRLRRISPGVVVEVEVGHSAFCLDNLSRGLADLVIVSEGVDHRDMQTEPFLQDEIMVITAPGGPFSGRVSITPQEFLQEPFVARTGGSGTRAVLEARLRAAGLGFDQLNIVMALGSAEAVKGAVISGAGLGAVSRLAIDRELRDGRLRALHLEGIDLTRAFLAVRRPQDRRHRLMRTFLSVMKEGLRPDDRPSSPDGR